ncbi:hypothetical protein [Pseudomonas putida]|uniref:Uncharacterized protein n=1 Tax=Pseudomonas putida TaxID=303 RepID=A0A8I1EBV3_PSEPU|nr:hypothetical protein [Pseudomonas putida]MBI6882656.1 hypothetical protein [Pseudomonas putida]
MKIQFSLLNPEVVSRRDGTSILAGIAETKEQLSDYTVTPFLFRKQEVTDGPAKIMIAKHIVSDNLINRMPDFSENITSGSFTSVLQLHVWKGVDSRDPAGELAFVKTNFPGTPEGSNTYVVFGIVKGDRESLKAMSDTVFEASFKGDLGTAVFSIAEATSTGREAKHVIGNSLLNIIKQPLWGFGETKYGIRSDISIATAKELEENNLHIIEHGVNKPGMRLGKVEPEFVEYLREMHANGMFPGPQWISAEGEQTLGKVASGIIRRQAAEQRMESTKSLAASLRILSDGPSI